MTKKEIGACGLALAVLLILAVVFWRFFIDDAFIGFRYIDNVLHGKGFVFNPPDRVEGLSNIGWLLVLLPFAWIIPVTVAAKLLAIILVVASLALIIGFASRALEKGKDQAVLLLLPLLIAANLDFIYFSLTGMETPLAAFVLVLMLVLAERRMSFIALAFLGAFLFLVRPECVLLFPLFLLFHNGTRADPWKRSASSILIFIILIAILTSVRMLYFGTVLPNTFYAKSTTWGVIARNLVMFLTGLNSNFSFPFLGWLAMPLWVYGLRLLRRSDAMTGSFLAAALSTGLFFGFYARPDWTGMGRYFAPYVPIALFIFLVGLVDLIRKGFALWPPSRKIVPAAVGLIGAAFMVAGGLRTIEFLRSDELEDYPGYVLTSRSLIEPSLWMRDHLPDGAVIATGRIGAIAYYSGKRIFDYKFGLTEPTVAGLRRRALQEFEDPRDPELEKIWMEVRPGYFLEDLRRLRKIFHPGPGKIDILTIHGLDYRPLKSFSIGIDAEWSLWERIDRSPEVPAKRIDISLGKH